MDVKQLAVDTLSIERDHRNNGIHSRVVYLDSNRQMYFKKWELDFFYRHFFEHVYRNTQFLQQVSLIEDVIEDEHGHILGYVTPKCKSISYATNDKHKYNDLIDRVAKACHDFNVAYIDFNVHNVVEKDNRYYLIDLEASIPVPNLPQIPKLDYILEYNDYFYVKKIESLLGAANLDPKLRVVRQHTKHDKDIVYGTANGRIYLEKEYLPALKGKTLFVGVNYYTDFYPRLIQTPELFETLDVAESVIEHGSTYKHYIGNILDFKNPGYLYDNVCFFGILGHPDDWDILKQKEEMIRCIQVLDAQVAPGGTLLLGPACVTISKDFWDETYRPLLRKYDVLMLKKIDINYIWYGRKR